MDGFVISLLAVPIAILISLYLSLYFRKRKQMRRLSAVLGATYDPNWILLSDGFYGIVRGAIQNRTFKSWGVSGRGGSGSLYIQMPCRVPTLAGVLSGRDVQGNFNVENVFPEEVVQAIETLLADQGSSLSETAMTFSKGRLTFNGHELLWHGYNSLLRNPELFAPVVPVLACIATCLENSDIQRKFIGLVQSFHMNQKRI